MEAYKREFIEFMVESDVLKFGDFTLKSGRKSPFFMNAGAYVTGEQLHRLGLYYAQAINDNLGSTSTWCSGPASKGIPWRWSPPWRCKALRQGSEVLLQPQGSEGPRGRCGQPLGRGTSMTATRSSWWRTSPLGQVHRRDLPHLEGRCRCGCARAHRDRSTAWRWGRARHHGSERSRRSTASRWPPSCPWPVKGACTIIKWPGASLSTTISRPPSTPTTSSGAPG